jgi:hypothetical protein
MKKPQLPAKRINVAKPKLKSLRRTKSVEDRVTEAISNVPRITNETVADHREDVLSSARKYIYPLKHSSHSIVKISISIFVGVIILFFAFCGLDLYKFQGKSGFIYDVTKILPFPVAKVGNSYVGYDSYLFNLRSNIHYYTTVQKADFNTPSGKLQLDRLKQQAMASAIQTTLVNKLAKQNNITVSSTQINNEITILKNENRLGSSNGVFSDVISTYYGWSQADFKNSLKNQLLSQAVVGKLDTQAQSEAQSAITELKSGTDFGTLASEVSDDAATKGSGGQYPNAISIDDPDLSPVVTETLFKLNPGQISGIVDSGTSLEILKVIDKSGNTLHAAHIQFNLNNITTYIDPIEKADHTHQYIKA